MCVCVLLCVCVSVCVCEWGGGRFGLGDLLLPKEGSTAGNGLLPE